MQRLILEVASLCMLINIIIIVGVVVIRGVAWCDPSLSSSPLLLLLLVPLFNVSSVAWMLR